jgi:hypothetical protein
MDEQVQIEIAKYRATAQTMGDAALKAIVRGDIGLARTAARQAAQWARVVVQLETGEKQHLTGTKEAEEETPLA